MGCLYSVIFKAVGLGESSSSVNKVTCDCPPAIPFEKLAIKPKYCTPIDRLGFPRNFCFCCSTRIASGFICLLSFLWAGIELQCAAKTMSDLFSDGGSSLLYSKMVYSIICVGFLLSCGCLLFGVVIRKQQPVHCFVWYGFIFNLITVLIAMAVTISSIFANGEVSKRQTVKLVMAIVWWMIFMYLLMVVNSYKLNVWYRTLGFGL